MNMNKSKTKTYSFSVLLTLAVGALSSFLTSTGMERYKLVEKPPLTPPDILFPIVWTVLYILMGISFARVFMKSEGKIKSRNVIVYSLQLFFNFMWSVLFFVFQAYGFAFVWLVALWLLIILMIYSFYQSDRLAAILQIPYLLWVSFAGYLNFMVWMLNK